MTTKKEAIQKLTDAGVEFDPKLKLSELHQLFPEILSEDDDESDEDEEEESDKETTASNTQAESAAPIPTSFVIKNLNTPEKTSVRTFDEATHGVDYKTVAASFAESNTLKKITPDMTPEQKKEITDFNVNIKHPIISSN